MMKEAVQVVREEQTEGWKCVECTQIFLDQTISFGNEKVNCLGNPLRSDRSGFTSILTGYLQRL